MTISNSDKVIDSRDVIDRIRELTEERYDIESDSELADEQQADALREWDDYNGEELRILRELEDEASRNPYWPYGETLILDSYFKEYAQELAYDIGAVNSEATWPNNFIDWDAAADALKQDYFPVEFDGVTYWIRS